MTGWECPKCGSCYSPLVPECLACRPKPFTSHVTVCSCGTSAVCPLHGYVQMPTSTCEMKEIIQ